MRARWEKYSLGSLADIVGGGTPSRGEAAYFGGPIPWVTPTDLPPIGEVRPLGQTAETLTELGLQKSAARLIPSGTVLFSSRASIGKIAVTDRACATNQGFANFVPNRVVDPWFLAFLLSRHTPDIARLAGETTFKEVSKGKLREFTVSIPIDISEQRRIVSRIRDLLIRIDEVGRLRDEAISLRNALVGAFVEDNLCRPGFPEVSLRELLIAGPQNGVFKKRDQFGRGVLLANVADLYQRSTLDVSSLERVESTDVELEKFSLARGDVLVNRSSLKLEGLGRSCLFVGGHEPVVFECHVMRLRIDPAKLLPDLFVAFMNSPSGLKRIMEKAKLATMATWNQRDLASILVPVPPPERQHQLSQELEELEQVQWALATDMAIGASITAPLRTSVLVKAFAGEL